MATAVREITEFRNEPFTDFSDPANKEHVEFLARSIAEVGVKEPLKVTWEDGKL